MNAKLRRLLWPGLMTAGMLIVLLGLGSWQVKRLFWKEALLAQIAHAEAAPPIALPNDPSPFVKVSVTGTYLPDASALYGADVRDDASGPTMGAQLIVPLRQTNGEVILVDRGWVPLSRTHPIDQPAGMVTVSGYVWFGDTAHWFSAPDDVAARHFFTLDPKKIATTVGQPNASPYVLVQLANSPAANPKLEQWPVPARHLPRPPNNHLSYVITWYGLAVALLAIFVVWARKELRA